MNTRSAASTEPAAVSQADDSLGRHLYGRDCASCHGASGEGTSRGVPIRDSGAASIDFMVASGRMPIVTEEFPRRVRYGEEERAALVDYASQLTDGPGIPVIDTARADLASGATLYRSHCAQCHGTSKTGTALAFGVVAPPIKRVPPLQVAEATLTGPGAMPSFGPAVLSERDVEDIAAYVAFDEGAAAPPADELGGGRLGEAAISLGLGVAMLVLATTRLVRR